MTSRLVGQEKRNFLLQAQVKSKTTQYAVEEKQLPILFSTYIP